MGKRITAWLTGEKRVLIIGGEPANGKSLLMGELFLRHNTLVKSYPSNLSPSCAIISYDQVHYLFLKCLADLNTVDVHNILPEGETYPEARKCITQIMQEVLGYALSVLPEKPSLILEAPLIGDRGEAIADKLLAQDGLAQVFITHSPAMQSRVLQKREQQLREISAQPLAIRQIHEALLQGREITSLSQQEQDSELVKIWGQWLGDRDGLVLSWDPADDEIGFICTKENLKAANLSPNPLIPKRLEDFTLSLIETALKKHPNLEAFASAVRNYH